MNQFFLLLSFTVPWHPVPRKLHLSVSGGFYFGSNPVLLGSISLVGSSGSTNCGIACFMVVCFQFMGIGLIFLAHGNGI